MFKLALAQGNVNKSTKLARVTLDRKVQSLKAMFWNKTILKKFKIFHENICEGIFSR